MASGVDTRSRGSVSVTESPALVLKEAALRIGRSRSMSAIGIFQQQSAAACFVPDTALRRLLHKAELESINASVL
jgi:hypothetical protein